MSAKVSQTKCFGYFFSDEADRPWLDELKQAEQTPLSPFNQPRKK
jgi:hypothetical protein